MKNFKSFDLPKQLFGNLEKIGFEIPTPIQAKAIPHALNGEDILGSAQTGTGKTGAYGIPLVTHLMKNLQAEALILLPTRELATQVLKALRDLIGKERINAALLIGGEPMAKQYSQLKQKPRLIVATPGRANDHLKRKSLKLKNVTFLVLDEIDRMLDMGFSIQLEEIAQYITSDHQTLMFSATVPATIKKLAAKYLKSPVYISVGKDHAPAEKVKQENIKMSEGDKFPRLMKEIEERKGSIIVFVATKVSADRIAGKLFDKGYDAKALHGDLHQVKRTRVISAFRNGKCRILIATDVAARGLDIPHIEHVINHDLPQNSEDYIHRIGRTARAGAEGHAINFITPKDSIKWRNIAKLINPGSEDSKCPSRGPSRGRSFSERNSRDRTNTSERRSQGRKSPYSGSRDSRYGSKDSTEDSERRSPGRKSPYSGSRDSRYESKDFTKSSDRKYKRTKSVIAQKPKKNRFEAQTKSRRFQD